MDKKILFSESQKFKQWWLWLILLGINVLLGVAVFYQIVSGDQPGDDAWLLITLGISLLLTILFFNLRLDTHIKKDGVYVRFLPFNRSFKRYAWESLSKSFVRKYSAMGEFGGWGVKWDFSFKGKAMNISGDKGLQLELLTGKDY